MINNKQNSFVLLIYQIETKTRRKYLRIQETDSSNPKLPAFCFRETPTDVASVQCR